MKRIIGIGNEFRKDDAVGLVVARRLKGKLRKDVEIFEASGEGTQLMELWKDCDEVILIDALNSADRPGNIRRFEAHSAGVPALSFRYSTHAFSLGEAIELARALGQLPPKVIVLGIEGKDFSAGQGLCPEVENAAEALIGEISDRMGGS